MTENPLSDRIPAFRRSMFPLIVFAFLVVCLPFSAEAWTKKGKKPAKEKTESSVKAKPSKAELTAVKAAAKARKSLAKARTLRGKGKIDMALAEYQEAIELDPSYAEAYLEMGALYFESNLPQPAAQALEIGVPLARQQGFDAVLIAQGYCQLAESYRRLGRLNEAIEQTKTASEIAPQDALPWKIAGAAHLDADNDKDAVKALQEAVKLDAHLVEAWELLGKVALQRKDATLAQTVYEGLYRCDTFKAGLYKTDMDQAGFKAVAPKTPATAPLKSGGDDDPYAVGPSSGKSSPGQSPSPPSSIPALEAVKEPVKATPPVVPAAKPVSAAPTRPEPPKPPAAPAKPTPVPIARPGGQKAFSPGEPPPLTLPQPPQEPKPVGSGQAKTPGKASTTFRSSKPLDPSDTLISEVIPRGATTTLPVLNDDGSTAPPETDSPPGSTTPADDPYAAPETAHDPSAYEPAPPPDDPEIPGGEDENGPPPDSETSLPMLPEDQAPPAATGGKTGGQADVPAQKAADQSDDLVVVASSGSEEIPEDRIFALFSNLSAADNDIAAGARKRLAGYGAAAAPHLMQRLNDSNPVVRLRVMQTLGDLGKNALVAADQIRKLSTSDPDPKVREAAQQLVQSLSSSR